MIIERQFSRHTPDRLIKYKNYKDEDFDKMSRGDKMRAIDLEDDQARRNTNKYIWKKVKKHGGVGAAGGATLGAALGGKGVRVASGVLGGITGGLVGVATGSLRGQYIADREGHNRDKRALSLARRIDKRSKVLGRDDDDYELRQRDKIQTRMAQEEARRAQATANYALMRTW